MTTTVRAAYSMHVLRAHLGGFRPLGRFGQFSGSDLDRFIGCVGKVRSEGLSLDKYCEAGINQSTGNVYIWSEDWAGCVYCGVGSNVAWSYSCPECGEEHDFATEQECREYAEKHGYECESCNHAAESEEN